VVIFIDMGNVEILEKALRLPPEERFVIVEGLLKSLDIPDLELDRIWAEEAERRLAAYRNGKLSGVPIEEVFGSK
jgi:putative addiction module component (TIGR02574 family)